MTNSENKKDDSKLSMILWFAGAVIWLLSAGIGLYGVASGGSFNYFIITQIGMAIFSAAMGLEKLLKLRKVKKNDNVVVL